MKERLETLYKLLGYEHLSEFAVDAGIKAGTAQQQANRGRLPYATAAKYVERAKGTGATIDWLINGRGDPPRASHESVRNLTVQIDAQPLAGPLSQKGHAAFSGEARGPVPFPQFGETDLRVFNVVDIGGGLAVLSSDPVAKVARPDEVKGVPDAFGAYVSSDHMDPAYLPGDFLCISPVPPPAPNKDVMLMTAIAGSPEVRVALRRLVSITETHWVCRQHKPAKTERFDRKTWPLAYRIVARFLGK